MMKRYQASDSEQEYTRKTDFSFRRIALDSYGNHD